MKFANSSSSPIAQFCRDPDGFASFGGIETFLDIDVGLVFAALEELVECLSYRLLIVIHLGSVDMGEAGIKGGDDLGGCILVSEGRTCAKCEIRNTTSVVENGCGRHGYQRRNKRGSRGVPKCSEVEQWGLGAALLSALLRYYTLLPYAIRHTPHTSASMAS